MGIVFQDFNLLSDRNVYQNLQFVLKSTGWLKTEIESRINEVLALVGMGSKGFKMVYELSGGEQQRLVIARAILNKPEVILADEPTGNLDPTVTDDIMLLLKTYATKAQLFLLLLTITELSINFPIKFIGVRKEMLKR